MNILGPADSCGVFRVLENVVCFCFSLVFFFLKVFFFLLVQCIVSLTCSSFPVHHTPDLVEEDNPCGFGVWWLRWSTVRILMVSIHNHGVWQGYISDSKSLFIPFTSEGLAAMSEQVGFHCLAETLADTLSTDVFVCATKSQLGGDPRYLQVNSGALSLNFKWQDPQASAQAFTAGFKGSFQGWKAF